MTHGQIRLGDSILAQILKLERYCTNVPAEFISDDCFKFFNPVSTESLTQYTAQWKTALMRASQYLSDEHQAA